MCGNTKQRIAAALRQLMKEKPFQKITVQNLMDVTNMKRQSFYYHFQDTRDVLMWICQQELVSPLQESEQDFSEWVLTALELLDQDRAFYRRAFHAAQPEFSALFGQQVLYPRLANLLYGTASVRQLDSARQFAVEFLTNAALTCLGQFVSSRKALDKDTAARYLKCLLDTLHLTEQAQTNFTEN